MPTITITISQELLDKINEARDIESPENTALNYVKMIIKSRLISILAPRQGEIAEVAERDEINGLE